MSVAFHDGMLYATEKLDYSAAFECVELSPKAAVGLASALLQWATQDGYGAETEALMSPGLKDLMERYPLWGEKK